MKTTVISLVAGVIITLATAAGAQTIWYVDGNAAGANDGTSWTDAFNDLQDGLGVAVAGDQVWVAAGLYTPDGGTGNPDLAFQIRDGIAIYGGFAGGEISLEERDWRANETILSGDLAGNDGPGFANYEENSHSVVQALASVSDDITAGRLDGFTVTGGAGSGGGIFCHTGRATIVHCTITANLGLLGGGIYSYLSDFTLTDCTIADNAATEDGGGIYLFASSPVIDRCTLRGNEAGHDHAGPYRGGAIECTGGSQPTIRDDTITGNTADWWGGGISISSGARPWIVGCTITANSCDYFGGGIGCDLSAVTVTDTLINGNAAGWYGGGITGLTSTIDMVNCIVAANSTGANGGGLHAIERSTLSLMNVTITGNSAGGPGGGLAISDILTDATLANCILWDDSPGEIDATMGATLDATYCDVEGGWTGEGNIDADPLFVEPTTGDLHLLAASPCRDAASATAPQIPANDFEGDDRLADGLVDIGADEFHVHLYAVGEAVPGATVTVRILGNPADRVLLALGSGVRDEPRETPFGPLYLELPLIVILDLGSIPETGLRELGLRVPVHAQPGQHFPFQALAGVELTNLMEVVVAD